MPTPESTIIVINCGAFDFFVGFVFGYFIMYLISIIFNKEKHNASTR